MESPEMVPIQDFTFEKKTSRVCMFGFGFLFCFVFVFVFFFVLRETFLLSAENADGRSRSFLSSLRTYAHSLTLSLREKCPYFGFFWSVFSGIQTSYSDISPCSVQMRENTDQTNSEYGHFTQCLVNTSQNLLGPWLEGEVSLAHHYV